MFSNPLCKVLVVASVALVLPVLGGGAAHADSGDAHGNKSNKGTSTAAQHEPSKKGTSNGSAKADSDATSRSTAKSTRSSTDPSGSRTSSTGTFQGKATSAPDQDGKGMNRGGTGDDKSGPGTDGNNGCGNEPRLAAPRDGGRPTDDDNNGWCGSKPKPQRTATSATVPVQAAPTAVVTAPQPAAVAPQGVAVPTAGAAQAATARANLRVVALDVAPARVVTLMGPPTGVGAVVAQSAVAPMALPFTGAPTALLLLLGGLAAAGGAALTLAARRTA